MRFPSVRFTIRSLMIAVGILAGVLALEPVLFHCAAEEVRSGDEHYIWGEAVTVWVVLNVALSLPIGLAAMLVWASVRSWRAPKSPGLNHGSGLVQEHRVPSARPQ